jgi:hypothetical protein
MLSGRLPALALSVLSLGLLAGCKDIKRLQEKALGLDDDDDPKTMSVSAETTNVEDLGGGTYRTSFRVTVKDENDSLYNGSLEVTLSDGDSDGARTYPIGQDFYDSWSAGHGQGYPEESCVVTGSRVLAEGSVIWSSTAESRELRFDAVSGNQIRAVGILDLEIPPPSEG